MYIQIQMIQRDILHKYLFTKFLFKDAVALPGQPAHAPEPVVTTWDRITCVSGMAKRSTIWAEFIATSTEAQFMFCRAINLMSYFCYPATLSRVLRHSREANGNSGSILLF